MTKRYHSLSHHARPHRFRPFLAATLLLAAFLILLPFTGRAQLLGSVTEGLPGSPYTYYLTIQFANGHYYDYTLLSTTASYTGTSFINMVAAGSQSTPLVLTVGQVASSFGNYINAITINGDTNSGFVNNSYWSYWTGGAASPVAWTYSQVGEDSRTLTSGQADGWVYGDGSTAPAAMTFAVPEPSAWSLACLGLTAGSVWTIRRRSPVAR